MATPHRANELFQLLDFCDGGAVLIALLGATCVMCRSDT